MGIEIGHMDELDVRTAAEFAEVDAQELDAEGFSSAGEVNREMAARLRNLADRIGAAIRAHAALATPAEREP